MLDENNNPHDLNLWQKLAAISNAIGHIEKTGRNSHFNYAFMEHAQVVAVIRPILDEYGVTVDLEALDATYSEKNRVMLHMSYTVTNADKPSETFTRRWVSEAMDQQDKGINKALTAAEKNVFAKLFHISDQDLEDDANDTQPAKKQAAPTRQQAAPQATRPATTPNTAPTTSRPAQAPAAPQAASRPVTAPAPNPAPALDLATEQQRTAIVNMAGRKGVDDIELADRLQVLYGSTINTLTRDQASHFIKVFQQSEVQAQKAERVLA